MLSGPDTKEHINNRLLLGCAVAASEERDRIIDTLLKITEANDISEGLDAVQATVRAAECLN